MIELSRAEIKSIALSILTDVAEYCEQEQLRYFLVCGTALGAVRHDGFIPWDDDVDIGMPRSDYERFVKSYRSEKYYVVSQESGKNYPYAFAKVCDNETELIEHITRPFPLGVYIDVFPIDGIPSDPRRQKQHLKRIENDLRVLSWKRISRERKLDLIHKIIQITAKTVLAPIPVSVLVSKLDHDLRRYEYESCEYAGHLATKAYWGKDLKPKSVFEPATKHVFEGREYWIPGDYDAYLSLEYGEYMSLPPVEKRVPAHDYQAYWKS